MWRGEVNGRVQSGLGVLATVARSRSYSYYRDVTRICMSSGQVKEEVSVAFESKAVISCKPIRQEWAKAGTLAPGTTTVAHRLHSVCV